MNVIDYLHSNVTVLLCSSAALGLCVGSFLNVVIHRLPGILEFHWMRQARELLDLDIDDDTPPPGLSTPGSHCPVCKNQISALHNIPVLSYLILRGKCAKCGTKISIRYPLP